MSIRASVFALVLITCCAATAVAAGAARPRGGFTARIDNPWFPLRPGTVYVYTGVKDGRPSRDVMTVTHRTTVIDGAPCAVIAWYTQDSHGNVWYYGESTAELDAKGHVTSRSGSWRAGVRGAVPGIFMPAHPAVGQSFRQEYFKGEAEDHFQVLGVAAGVTLLTKEWTPLEPAVLDHKLYVRGLGMVLEQSVKGPEERGELVQVRRG